MLEGFVGMLLICMVDDPGQCMPVNGRIMETRDECTIDLIENAVPYFGEREDVYIAGLACVETQLLGEAL